VIQAPSAQDIRAAVGGPLESLGPLPDGWAERLAVHLARLLERNQSVNLVSRASADRILEAQLVPSLGAVLRVPPGQPLRILDIGSGGGFPGIPIAIVRPDVQVDLVDATRKKVAFLEEVLRELDLVRARAHWCRIEEPTPELTSRGPFDRAFARAVGAAPRIAAAVQPLLAPGAEAWRFGAPGIGGHPWPEADPETALFPLDA
jgi:16S rRNA (guanine527-N7)-methyltransferase